MNEKFFVPFKTAKLLKGKGYPQESDSFQECDLYYYDDGELEAGIAIDTEELDDCFYSPTYHEVVDWLEGRKVRIYAEYCNGWWYGFIDNSETMEIEATVRYQTREQALNEGILKALKML